MKTLKTLLLLMTLVGFAFAPINNDIGGAYATFNGKFGGDITGEDLRTTTEIGVSGCAAGSKIYTFSMSIHSGSKTLIYKGTSHEFTVDMMMSLKSLKTGDFFEFSHMKAKLPTGGKVDVVSKKFTVI